MIIKEIFASQHYLERKAERGTILEINVAKQFYEKYGKEKLDSKLKAVIEKALLNRLASLETFKTAALKSNQYRIITALAPVLKTGESEYPIVIKAGESVGNVYVVVVAGDVMVTLLLLKGSADIRQQAISHIKRTGADMENVTVDVLPPLFAKFKIDLENLMGEKEISLKDAEVTKEELPYRVRTDYRKGGTLVHDVFGHGIITNTSTGASGQPNSEGMLSWVDVDFHKPFVKSGKLEKYRRLTNIYTNSYWLARK